MKIQLCIAMLLFISCSDQSNKGDGIEPNDTFTITESNQLTNLLHAFDQAISKIEGVESNDINRTYNSFFKRMKEQTTAGGTLNIGIDSTTQASIESQISAELTNELWRITPHHFRRKNNNIDTIIFPAFNAQGKFFKFLKEEVAPENEVINTAVDGIEIIRDISPSINADILINYDKYDISDDRVRLLIAVHYLAVNKKYLIAEE